MRQLNEWTLAGGFWWSGESLILNMQCFTWSTEAQKWEEGGPWSGTSIISQWLLSSWMLNLGLEVQTLLCHDLRWNERELRVGGSYVWSAFKALNVSYGIWSTQAEDGLCYLRARTSVDTIFDALKSETSLVVNWLIFHAAKAGNLDLVPGWGTRFRMLLRVCTLQQRSKTPCATTKTRYSQISKYINKY